MLPVSLLFCLMNVPLAWGDVADEQDTLDLLQGQGEIVTTGRLPRPLSRSGENILVISVDELRDSHAHTLLELLATLPGFQLEAERTPGSFSFLHLQGAGYGHLLVLLDGVPLNNLSDNYADLGLIPMRIIDRLEIVKGAASSGWGQALGGVVNVITRSGEPGNRPNGELAVALAGQGSSDLEGAVGGVAGSVGYFFSGGYRDNQGLLPTNQVHASDGYGKLALELPQGTRLTGTLGYFRARRGDFDYPLYGIRETSHPQTLVGSLQVSRPLVPGLTLLLSGRHNTLWSDIQATDYTGELFHQIDGRESLTGGSVNLMWQQHVNTLALGLEYDHVNMHNKPSINERSDDRWGLYLHDTLVLGPVSLSPGARFDTSNATGDQFSPTLGVTWQIAPTTLVRGYTARGYSLPSFTLSNQPEKVWTSQVGLETTALPWVWLKTTLLRNETWNILRRDLTTERHLTHGIETEFKTTPYANMSLSGGYTYLDVLNRTSGGLVGDSPRHTLQLSLQYDYHPWIKGTLTARHLWWNRSVDSTGRYQGLVWNLFLSSTPFPDSTRFQGVELFFSVRNMFNADQYLNDMFLNTGRWFEGGVRFRF